jgi:hypothetical protein
MSRRLCAAPTVAAIVACGVVVSLAAGSLVARADDEAQPTKIGKVYRDGYTITVTGKADDNGTFTIVFTPHGEEGTRFTVNVVKKTKAKKIAADVAKELTLAAGDRYKVKQKDTRVVVAKVHKKESPFALEITEQRLTGVAIMIAK